MKAPNTFKYCLLLQLVSGFPSSGINHDRVYYLTFVSCFLPFYEPFHYYKVKLSGTNIIPPRIENRKRVLFLTSGSRPLHAAASLLAASVEYETSENGDAADVLLLINKKPPLGSCVVDFGLVQFLKVGRKTLTSIN